MKRSSRQREKRDDRAGKASSHREEVLGSPRRKTIRFCVLFLALIVLFAVITSTGAAAGRLHEPLARLVALLSGSILSVFGSATVSGNTLIFNGFGASIVEACNGVVPTYIFVAAILAFPSRWKEKALGLLMGIPAIFLINLVRVITLMVLGAYWPDLFERVHIYVWQTLVIVLSMAVWIFWAEVFVRPGRRANP